MSGRTMLQTEALGCRSPLLFGVAGLLLAGHAVVSAMRAFTTLAPPPDVFVTTGHLLGVVALVGLYPSVAAHSPRLLRGGLAIAALPIGGWTAMSAVQFLVAADLVASMYEVLAPSLVLLVVVSTVVTYALFGLATSRVAGTSRSVSLLVATPGVLIVVLLVDGALTGSSAVDGVVIGGGLALSMGALGYELRSWDRTARQPTRGADVPAG